MAANQNAKNSILRKVGRHLLAPARSFKRRFGRRQPRQRVDQIDENNNETLMIVGIHRVSCVIQSGGTEEYLRCHDDRLSFGQLQDKDTSFLFVNQRINCLHNGGAGNEDDVYDFNAEGCVRTCVVGGQADSNVDVQNLSPLPDTADSLSASDSRFFIHHWNSTGRVSELESLKHRGYYLAFNEDDGSLALKQKVDSNAGNFHFRIKDLGDEAN